MGGLKNNGVVGNVIAGIRQDVCASFQAVMKNVFINLLETFFSMFTSLQAFPCCANNLISSTLAGSENKTEL